MANLSDASGVITSPFYPRYYPDDQNCMWDIVASNGKHLKLEIEKTTNIQQCNQCNCDYLDVQYGFDSSGNPSGKICKELTETVTYYSLKDRLRVQFHSDNLQEFIFMGFRAVYTQLESNPRSKYQEWTYLHQKGYKVHITLVTCVHPLNLKPKVGMCGLIFASPSV